MGKIRLESFCIIQQKLIQNRSFNKYLNYCTVALAKSVASICCLHVFESIGEMMTVAKLNPNLPCSCLLTLLYTIFRFCLIVKFSLPVQNHGFVCLFMCADFQ